MNPEVVVVGAGPTGLATAALLGRRGIECLVLERWPACYPQPRAVHLDDEVCRILDRIGIADEFARHSYPGAGLRLVTAGHHVLAEFPRDPGPGRHGYPAANMFDEPDLERILREHVATLPTVTLRSGVEVTGLHHIAGGVRVDLTDRVTHGSETLTAAAVVGCDGANSVCREAIGAELLDLGFEQRWLVLDVRTTVDFGLWDGVHQLCDAHRAATYMRVGPSRHRWEFRLLPGESAADLTGIETFEPLLRPWIGDADLAELELIRSAQYTFRARLADRWRDGRILLAGDAAHLTPPFVGQGLGAGLRDAANLEWKLAGVLRGALPDSVLDTYESERRPHARAMVQGALLVGRIMTARGRLRSGLRETAAGVVGRLPGLARLAGGETPALAVPAPPKGLRHRLVGSLLPNARLGNGRRVDDAAGNSFVVVTRDDVPEHLAGAARRAGAVVLTAPLGSDLATWLAAARLGVVVARPDRTIAAAGHDVAAAVTLLPAPRRQESAA